MAQAATEFDTRFYNHTTQLTTYASNGGVNVIKTTPGFLHAVTFASLDGAPTAGEITIYDGTAIYGSGMEIMLKHSQTTAAFMPTTVILDIPFDEGLSVGFTAAIKDVGVTLSYK